MNENPYVNDDSSKGGMTGVSGFMLGALVGAGVALLFAPATGTDTRRKLGETAKRLGSAARDKIQEGKNQIQDRLQGERQGFEAGSSSQGQGSYGPGRREPVPSAGGVSPSGSRPGTPGRTTP